MIDELKYLVGLSGFNGLGIKRLGLLKKYFGSAERIWRAEKAEWVKVGISPETAANWKQWRGNHDLDEELEELARYQIRSITIDDENYPKLLKETDFAPFIIFVKGGA